MTNPFQCHFSLSLKGVETQWAPLGHHLHWNGTQGVANTCSMGTNRHIVYVQEGDSILLICVPALIVEYIHRYVDTQDSDQQALILIDRPSLATS